MKKTVCKNLREVNVYRYYNHIHTIVVFIGYLPGENGHKTRHYQFEHTNRDGSVQRLGKPFEIMFNADRRDEELISERDD